MNEIQLAFDAKFEVLDADTSDLLEKVYALRYQVYCIETGFENKDQFPDGRERDQFDDRAIHGLVVTRDSHWPLGTIRLVRPQGSRPGPQFPMELVYPNLLASRGYGPHDLPWDTTAEISRFAISKAFKRRPGEPGSITGVTEESLRAARVRARDERRRYPHIILGLFLSLARLSAQAGLTHWVAVMEYPLLRLIDRFGFKFEHIGKPIEFHGLRQPCVGCIEDMLSRIYYKRRDVWDFMTNCGRIWPPPQNVPLLDKRTLTGKGS